MCPVEGQSWKPRSAALTDLDLVGAVVVHFWAPWNGHDREQDSVLAALAAGVNRVQIRSCDISDVAVEGLVRRARVLNVPTLVLLIDGEPKERLVGVRSESELQGVFRSWGETYAFAV